MTTPDLLHGHFLAELCADKAGEDWQASAYTFFVGCAAQAPYLTTAAVRRAFEAAGGAVPHDGRAWGHICLRAQRDEIITHSGKYVRDGSHGRPNAVWRSLIVEPSA